MYTIGNWERGGEGREEGKGERRGRERGGKLREEGKGKGDMGHFCCFLERGRGGGSSQKVERPD